MVAVRVILPRVGCGGDLLEGPAPLRTIVAASVMPPLQERKQDQEQPDPQQHGEEKQNQEPATSLGLPLPLQQPQQQREQVLFWTPLPETPPLPLRTACLAAGPATALGSADSSGQQQHAEASRPDDTEGTRAQRRSRATPRWCGHPEARLLRRVRPGVGGGEGHEAGRGAIPCPAAARRHAPRQRQRGSRGQALFASRRSRPGRPAQKQRRQGRHRTLRPPWHGSRPGVPTDDVPHRRRGPRSRPCSAAPPARRAPRCRRRPTAQSRHSGASPVAQ